jgi:hypothetical protein
VEVTVPPHHSSHAKPGALSPRRKVIRLVASELVVSGSFAVSACEEGDAGQLLYNIAKTYCDNRPEACGGKRHGIP